MGTEGSFKALHDDVLKALVDVTRTTRLLSAEDLGFFRTSDRKGAKKLDKQNTRLLQIASRLIQTATKGPATPAPSLGKLNDVGDSWEAVVEIVDNLLEKADLSIDEYTGVIKKLSSEQEAQAASASKRGGPVLKVKGYPKPQLQFDKIPKNDETTGFRPLLRVKPHAIISLEESISPTVSRDGHEEYGHPYATEINSYKYPSAVYQKSDPILYHPFESTSATFVDSLDGVRAMLSELKDAKEIAIDLEHHDKHSYIGLVSLMQISTRDKDWIVDTLKPWRAELQMLNEVFADPSIVKVLHGAFMDIMWLQRDLGLYIVGLFDTYHASVSLRYPRHGLAYLLKRFVDFDAQKKYQMADWRVRPLSTEMFDYARSDTHFLLYIYDNMRNELLEGPDPSQPSNALIDEVLSASKQECLQKFEWPFYDAKMGTGASGWYNMLARTPALFSKQQFSVFRAVHEWRDQIARLEDESLSTVMTRSALFNVAREMPADIPALFGCVQPMSDPVRRRTSDLVRLIASAKSNGENGPDMKTVMQEHPLTQEQQAREAERNKFIHHSGSKTLAQIIEQERKKSQEALEMPQDSYQSAASQFWGATIDSNEVGAPDQSLQDARMAELCLEVPLPPLTAQIFAENEDGAVGSPSAPVLPEHQFKKMKLDAPLEPAPDVFIIKDLGRGKKRKQAAQPEADAPSEAPESERQPGSPDDSPVSQRQMKKQDKERRKAAQRQKAEAERTAQEQADQEAPFDYAAASSMLNAKAPSSSNKGKEQGGTKNKPVNPYTKSMDAPVGLKRIRKDIEGKSFTFKG